MLWIKQFKKHSRNQQKNRTTLDVRANFFWPGSDDYLPLNKTSNQQASPCTLVPTEAINRNGRSISYKSSSCKIKFKKWWLVQMMRQQNERWFLIYIRVSMCHRRTRGQGTSVKWHIDTLTLVKSITWDIEGATNNLGSKASTTGCYENPKDKSFSKTVTKFNQEHRRLCLKSLKTRHQGVFLSSLVFKNNMDLWKISLKCRSMQGCQIDTIIILLLPEKGL